MTGKQGDGDEEESVVDLWRLAEEREDFESRYQGREQELVLAARREGYSWEEIAEALGRTKSSVWKKYHEMDITAGVLLLAVLASKLFRLSDYWSFS